MECTGGHFNGRESVILKLPRREVSDLVISISLECSKLMGASNHSGQRWNSETGREFRFFLSKTMPPVNMQDRY